MRCGSYVTAFMEKLNSHQTYAIYHALLALCPLPSLSDRVSNPKVVWKTHLILPFCTTPRFSQHVIIRHNKSDNTGLFYLYYCADYFIDSLLYFRSSVTLCLLRQEKHWWHNQNTYFLCQDQSLFIYSWLCLSFSSHPHRFWSDWLSWYRNVPCPGS